MLSLVVITLAEGERRYGTSVGREMALVVLSGKATLRCEGLDTISIGERESVFVGGAWAVYLPHNARFELIGETVSEVVACGVSVNETKAKWCGSPSVVPPLCTTTQIVGSGNHERCVSTLVDSRAGARYMLVGETITPPGNWSSYPPHKHDENDPPYEAAMEERYYYKFNPLKGFGFQRIYTADGEVDTVQTVQDGDTVHIPRGYHPVVAAPGYTMYYLWVLAGKEKLWTEDPLHKWVGGR